jgi:hypothetical protein
MITGLSAAGWKRVTKWTFFVSRHGHGVATAARAGVQKWADCGSQGHSEQPFGRYSF